MTGVDVLTDTNAVIAWIKQDRDLAQALLSFREPAISLPTLGELLFGAKNSSNPAVNLKTISGVRKSFGLFLPDEATAEMYATTRLRLRRQGRPIPENDVWIAAMALEYGIPIVTRDAQFKQVEGLNLVDW